MRRENDDPTFRYDERETIDAESDQQSPSVSGREPTASGSESTVSPAATDADDLEGDENESAEERASGARTAGSETTRADRPDRTESHEELPLLEDEEILVDARPSWWSWTNHLAAAVLLAVSGFPFGTQAAIGGIAIAIGIVCYVAARRSRVRYLVTDRRIVVISGFSVRKTNETWMEDIRGLQTRTTALGRRRGFGTITISHAVLPQGFSRVTGLRLPGVPNCEAVADAIRQRQSERKDGNY